MIRRIPHLCLLLALGCGDSAGSEPMDGLDGEDGSDVGSDGSADATGMDDQPAAGSDSVSSGSDPAGSTPIGERPADAPQEWVCSIGESRPCDCGDGVEGFESCTDVGGAFTDCTCPREGGSDVLVPPAEPEPMFCGDVSCPAYLEEDTEVGAKHCCTPDGACGSGSNFVFGTACYPRGGDPGSSDERCPDESPNFLDLVGCCRSDGMCGLSVDIINNFDLGCIERTEMDRLVEEGDSERAGLSGIFFLPHDNGDFQAIPCP